MHCVNRNVRHTGGLVIHSDHRRPGAQRSGKPAAAQQAGQVVRSPVDRRHDAVARSECANGQHGIRRRYSERQYWTRATLRLSGRHAPEL